MSQPAMAPTNCGECELPLRWEQIEDRRGRGERWLAICACGMPWAFFPGRPDYEPENPLGAALLAAAAPAEPSPPWIRLFQLTSHRSPRSERYLYGAGCRRGEEVFLISRLFPGHTFGGEGAITTIARAGSRFTRSFRVRRTTPRGRYVITARCGGGNLGVAAHLRVR